MRTHSVIRGTLLAALLAPGVPPASASTISLLSSDGHFRVIYDDTQSSILGQLVTPIGGGTIRFAVNGLFTGVADPDGRANGVTQTSFDLNLNARFVPEPGFAFTSLNMEDTGQIGVSYPLCCAGFGYNETSTVTALGSSTGQIVLGATPHLEGNPSDGQGGGGAYAAITLGSLIPPPAAGFDVSVMQALVLNSNTTFNIGRIEFDLGTVGVPIPPPAPVPEPGSLFLLGTGLLGLGCTVTRKMA